MRKTLLIIYILVSIYTTPAFAFAEELKSTNYKMTGVTLNGSGAPTTSNTGNFKLIETIGDFSADPRVFSTNYRTSLGQVEVFTANVPKISCFETTTNGSSSCTTGPSYLNSGGMTRVCGPTGCYDRARVEIDAQDNPADTLYAIQISTDSFVSEIKYIDGITHKPKVATAVTIDDYITKTNWESMSTNILGLQPNTSYQARVVALHGDFTESQPGPQQSVTTATPTLSFDIDIAPNTGTTTETSAPFGISFSGGRNLISAGPAITADDNIWLDAQTNAQGGFAILAKGLNGGLKSATTSYQINSNSEDLDGVVEGFGLQKYYQAQSYDTGSGNGALSAITIQNPYTLAGNNVGVVATVFNKLCSSSGPVASGRLSFMLKARASTSATPATDYSDTITLVIIPRY